MEEKKKRWKFGAGQSSKQERAEVREAREVGLERDYVRGQRWAQMIKAESERRRARKETVR